MTSTVHADQPRADRHPQVPGLRSIRLPADTREMGPLAGVEERSGRLAALPIRQRRALVGSAAWLITGYGGLAVLAAGIDVLISPSHRSMGLLLAACGALVFVFGVAHARNRIKRESGAPNLKTD